LAGNQVSSFVQRYRASRFEPTYEREFLVP